MTNSAPFLVLGGRGKTGSRIAARLAERGERVRIGSRSGEPPFDWTDRATWRGALTGSRAVYVSYQPDLAVPGAPDAIAAFAEAAIDAGVRRLVLLSGRGEEEAQRAEAVLVGSPADWTIIRSGFLNQNFSESFMLEMILAGELALPVGDVGEAFIDADDIADIAVAALTDDRHVGELYEVTGPRLLSFRDAIGEIARATGRDVRFETVSRDDFARGLVNDQVPTDVAWLLDYLFATVLDGRNAWVADGVERALGRPARDFRDYAQATAATGLWTSLASDAA